MRGRAAALLIAVTLVAPAMAAAERPFPPEPDYCQTRFSPGPTSTSCPFVYGGGRVTTFAAGVTGSAPATITIDVVRDPGPNEEVLFTCSATSDSAGSVPLPTIRCVRRSPVLPLEAGTLLRCRHRGGGYGVFGCLSP